MGRAATSVSARTRFPTSSALWKTLFSTGPVAPCSSAVSILQLAQDLGFSEKHRIQARGNSEKVPHRVSSGPTIQMPSHLNARNVMKRREKMLHRFCDGHALFRRHAVQFAAVASGKHHCFFKNSLAAEFAGRVKRLLWREGQPLAKLHRRRAVIASDQRNLNLRRTQARTIAFGNRRHQK
jgi:hypothetical protein